MLTKRHYYRENIYVKQTEISDPFQNLLHHTPRKEL